MATKHKMLVHLTTEGMEGLDNMHCIGGLCYFYLNYPQKNLLVAQDTSIQESEYAKHKEHDTKGAVWLCLPSPTI